MTPALCTDCKLAQECRLIRSAEALGLLSETEANELIQKEFDKAQEIGNTSFTS